MDNNEKGTQEFKPDDGGYTQAPDSQGNIPGQQGGFVQSSGQFNGQQNQFNGQQNQFNGQQNQFNGQYYAGQGGYVPKQNEPMGFAIAGMILGIVSIVCCCSPAVSGITGVLALIFSIMVLVQKRPGKGMAIAGIICAAVGIILAICMYIGGFMLLDYMNREGMNVKDLMDDFEVEGYY